MRIAEAKTGRRPAQTPKLRKGDGKHRESEEEPRNTRETPQRMAGHGSAGASPYRQGGGHGRAWGMGLVPANQDVFGCGRNSDGTRPDEEADRSAGRRPVRAGRPRSPFS